MAVPGRRPRRLVYLTAADKLRAQSWVGAGFTEALRTPDSTLIFVRPERANEILTDQINCMGCLSQCAFSNWSQNEQGTTGRKAIRAASASRRRCRRSAIPTGSTIS